MPLLLRAGLVELLVATAMCAVVGLMLRPRSKLHGAVLGCQLPAIYWRGTACEGLLRPRAGGRVGACTAALEIRRVAGVLPCSAASQPQG
jgi:hypothetical protein